MWCDYVLGHLILNLQKRTFTDKPSIMRIPSISPKDDYIDHINIQRSNGIAGIARIAVL